MTLFVVTESYVYCPQIKSVIDRDEGYCEWKSFLHLWYAALLCFCYKISYFGTFEAHSGFIIIGCTIMSALMSSFMWFWTSRIWQIYHSQSTSQVSSVLRMMSFSSSVSLSHTRNPFLYAWCPRFHWTHTHKKIPPMKFVETGPCTAFFSTSIPKQGKDNVFHVALVHLP